MSQNTIESPELETLVLAVYKGPLEGFISRRDALAKQLKASKRAGADQVKALRKPSRTAWTLSQVVIEQPALIEQLANAILDAQYASSRAPTARAAQENVKSSVRAVAEAAARVATRAGTPMQASALVTAVRAVIGDAGAFADFRAGRLVDVPEGGGLDLLTAMSLGAAASESTERTVPAPSSDFDIEQAASSTRIRVKAAKRPEEVSAAVREEAERAGLKRAEMARAESVLARAKERAQNAERAVLNAQARVEVADEQLQRAREQAEARAIDLERARGEAGKAADELVEAERSIAELRATAPVLRLERTRPPTR